MKGLGSAKIICRQKHDGRRRSRLTGEDGHNWVGTGITHPDLLGRGVVGVGDDRPVARRRGETPAHMSRSAAMVTLVRDEMERLI